MKSAFNKEVVRSITRSIGRFAAILIISLLGAGFFAGLRMAAPDMRVNGDEFFDGTQLYDLAVITSLGVDDETIEVLRDIEGIGEVMPAYRASAMALAGDNSYAAAVESIPIDAASASDTSDGVHAHSNDAAYLNRPILEEGAWPHDASECVIGIDAAQELDISIGSTLKLTEDIVDDGEDDDSAGDDDEDDDSDKPLLKTTTFTVSGLVNSPAYACATMLGTTSLGTGTIELYIYAAPEAFDEDLPYSIAYATVPAAHGKMWDTETYDYEVGLVKARVGEARQKLADARYATIKNEAQEELDDARADYEEERADAEEELEDARNELNDAQSELDDACEKLADARDELDNAHGDLQKAYNDLSDAYDQLTSSKRKLDQTQKQLSGAYAQLEKTFTMLERTRQAIEAGIVSDAKSLAQYEAGVKAYGKALAQYTAGAEAYNAGVLQYEQGLAEYEAGKKEYENGLAKYNDGVADYEDGKTEYDDGLREFADGVEEYEDGRAEADEKFADAEQELADAQAEIDDLEKPDVYILDRSKNMGCASLSSDAEGIDQIALFLPFMFFLVAALISLTSMTRMVEEERLDIGTHKALGYGKARITSKYLIYGLLASGVGSILGTVALGKLLPWFILISYGVSYAVPAYNTPIDLPIAAWAVGLSIGITLAATWWAAAATLREKPAALMVARVPKAGKRIFLERIAPLWSRMSFSHKVTARNLLRYKRRFFMAVLGVAGCTALLMVGFGLRDAIGGIVSTQYETLVNYDIAIRLDDKITASQRSQALDLLDDGVVESYGQAADFSFIAENRGDEIRIETIIPGDDMDLADFVTLRNRESQQTLELDEDSIVLTEKAADVLGVSVGDKVLLYDENDVGDKEGTPHRFTIGGISENYLGHYAYMTPNCYRSEFGKKPTNNMVFARLSEGGTGEGSTSSENGTAPVPDKNDATRLSDALLDIENVNTVSFVADKITTYESMLDVMNKLIFIIVGLSAALAFVVLYNLTNINITERIREIATLKVLGFTRGEVSAYIFREVLVMTLIGALVGCVLGIPLTFYIARAAETANMMFGRTIEPVSFVFSLALTLAFAAIVAITMRGKLSRVDMVESLKSIE